MLVKGHITSVKLLFLLTALPLLVSCEGEASYRPPFTPVKFVIDTLGNISIQAGASIVTPIGEFSISVKAAPVLHDDTLLLIIRDRKRGVDKMYSINSGSGEFSCSVNGSVTLRITNRQVLVDVTDGDIKSIDLQKRSLEQEIYDATKEGDTTIVSALLNTDPSLSSTKDQYGNTLMHLVAKNAQTATTADVLIANGADIDKPSYYGSTPLHYAAWYGNETIARWLIVHHADLNKQNKDGDTALHFAIRLGHKSIAQLLVISGADGNLKNTKGVTPLQSALEAAK